MATTMLVSHRGKVQKIALFKGLEPGELNSILQTVFGIKTLVVGFLSQVRGEARLSRTTSGSRGLCAFRNKCRLRAVVFTPARTELYINIYIPV